MYTQIHNDSDYNNTQIHNDSDYNDTYIHNNSDYNNTAPLHTAKQTEGSISAAAIFPVTPHQTSDKISDEHEGS